MTDNPKKALEEYHELLRQHEAAVARKEEAEREVERLLLAYQEAWRTVSVLRSRGIVKPGAYYLRGTGGDDVIVVSKHGDYPEIIQGMGFRNCD